MRVLIAGIGNIFLGDDGFGVAVAARLARAVLPPGVVVADFGVRGMHLAYELSGGRYDAAILVDAVARGEPPGTLYTIDADADQDVATAPIDAHQVTPALVLAWLKRLGGSGCQMVVIGCEPASIDESMELSPAVAAVVEDAASLVQRVVTELIGAVPCA